MISLTTPSTTTLVSLTQLKTHLEIVGSADDTRLTDMLADARDFLESQYNLHFTSQVWTQTEPYFPSWFLELQQTPVVSVIITYYDSDNVLTTLASSDYYIVKSHYQARVDPVDAWPATYDRPDAVSIAITCGATIPGDVKRACLEYCTEMNEHRGDRDKPNNGLERLIKARRKGWIA